MKRIGTHQLFIRIAKEVARRSTCARIQVGAVIVKDQRIISMGWNGVPHGQKHCIDHFQEKFDIVKSGIEPGDYDQEFDKWMNSTDIKEEHHQFAIENEVHSEMNSLIFAAKNGISTNRSDVYVVWSPCIDCAKALLQAGIKNVYYNKLYERDTRGIKFLEENGVPCIQVNEE